MKYEGPLQKMVKSEMRQIMWDGSKWKNETNFLGQREYSLIF